jgi:hypothetical protein
MGYLTLPEDEQERLEFEAAQAQQMQQIQQPQAMPQQQQPMQQAPIQQPVPQQQQPGFMSRLQTFGRDNSDMLLAAATGLGKGTQMGEMFGAVQEHYRLQDSLKSKKDANAAMLKLRESQLDETKRLNSGKIDAYTAKALRDGTAKVQSIGNGIVMVTTPGAQAPIQMTSQEYEDFSNKKIDRQGEWNVLASGVKIDAAPKTPGQEKIEQDARSVTEASGTALSRFRAAKEMLAQQGAPGIAGLPLVKQIGSLLGTDDAGALQTLGELKIDQAFNGMPRGQGTITDFERKILMQPMPEDYSDTGLWQKYVDRKLAVLEKAHAFNQAEEDKVKQTKNGLDTAQKVIKERRGMAQQYPPGFNPPSDGRAPRGDRAAILIQEFQAELAKPPSAQRTQNIESLKNELIRNKVPPPPGAMQAIAAKPTAGPPQFANAADVKAALAAGKLKSGDVFLGPDGKQRKVN